MTRLIAIWEDLTALSAAHSSQTVIKRFGERYAVGPSGCGTPAGWQDGDPPGGGGLAGMQKEITT